jgi:signal transduction histidine kinase
MLTHTASGPIGCSVDALRLEQVLTNLLENAMKFSPDPGTIEVEVAARRDAGTIQLSVRDHGRGIPPRSRERIFDRFYQGHEGMHASGMSLRLWISREIVALHGGRIAVESPPD